MELVRLIWLSSEATEKGLDSLTLQLSAEDLALAGRPLKKQDRLLALSARYLLRRFVGEGGRIGKNEYGKPVTSGLCFNLSHAADLTGLALARFPVGLDIEKEERQDPALSDFCLNEEEKASGLPFLDLFVAKEALAKAEGSGLGNDIFAVPALPREGALIYRGGAYYRKPVRRPGYHVSCCLSGDRDFIIREEVIYEI